MYDKRAGEGMRIQGKYVYPIITAILFPAVLTGLMWFFAELEDAVSVRTSNAKILPQTALAVAEARCFTPDQDDFATGTRHIRFEHGHWIVWTQNKGRIWVFPGIEKAATAIIDGRDGSIIECRYITRGNAAM